MSGPNRQYSVQLMPVTKLDGIENESEHVTGIESLVFCFPDEGPS